MIWLSLNYDFIIVLQDKEYIGKKYAKQRLQSNHNIINLWPQTQLYVLVPAKLPNLILCKFNVTLRSFMRTKGR